MFLYNEMIKNHYSEASLCVWFSCMQALRPGLFKCRVVTAAAIYLAWTVFWPETLIVPGTPQLNGVPYYPVMQMGKKIILSIISHESIVPISVFVCIIQTCIVFLTP